MEEAAADGARVCWTSHGDHVFTACFRNGQEDMTDREPDDVRGPGGGKAKHISLGGEGGAEASKAGDRRSEAACSRPLHSSAVFMRSFIKSAVLSLR